MVAATVKLEDVYTRKVGGEEYSYRLEYSPGERVEWHAEVFRYGERKGMPTGVLTDNSLQGPDLRQSVIALVEITIENMIDIAE